MRIFKHKTSGTHYRLLKIRESNINSFQECVESGETILKPFKWSGNAKHLEVRVLIKGFENLTEIFL